VSITRSRKEEILSGLTGELGSSGSVVLTDFTGIDVAGMTRLRNEMRRSGVRFMVVKNTLLRKTFDGMNIGGEPVVSLAQGPTAVAWSADEIAPVRIIRGFAKGNDGKPSIKGGFVSGRSFTAAEMIRLSELPSREELLARLLGSMNAPLQGFVNVTGGVLRGFLNAVGALRDKMEEGR